MAQIDSYLKRLAAENGLNYLDDFLDLYDFIPNEDLKTLLAVYHTQLNHWFAVLNHDINSQYDDEGNISYTGGYFHAQDSRDFLDIINSIEALKTKCHKTCYAFRISADGYDDAIRRCRRFIVKSGGSTIPEGFKPIEIVDLTPVFQLTSGITIEQDKLSIYSMLKSVGEGSYAQVFSYTDPTYKFPVILKRARPELDNKELARFKQEFDVLKELHSPYIVDVFAYNSEKNEYTMERMDETIYNFVQKNNNELSLASRKRIITQICRGLSYIHSKGYLHRDISLLNIFVKHYDDVDVVKIGDFGLVKTPESSMTSLQSELKGSLNDPDLVNVGFGNYEMRHETFALTRLCYFILTGRTNIERQKEGAIKRFWDKGTNPDKRKRFGSVAELLGAVQNIADKNK